MLEDPIIVKDFTTKEGYRAVVLYVNDSHHCGYVIVPKASNEIEKAYYTSDVHGGITYQKPYLHPLNLASNVTVVGFDAAHYKDTTTHNTTKYSTFKDANYMVNECIKLSTQLHAINNSMSLIGATPSFTSEVNETKCG